MKIAPSKPENYSLLLNVFRRGLRNGLVSKAEVVKWADGIILADDEPDYFFIEISLTSDIYQLLNIIATMPICEDTIVGRILLGLLHLKIENRSIDARKTVSILDEINAMKVLTEWEKGFLYQLSDEFDDKFGMKIFKEWETDTLEFLSDYGEFRIDNVVDWDIINSVFEERLKTI